MSTRTLAKVMVPRQVSEPRGASWADTLIELGRDGAKAIGTLLRMEAASARPYALAVWRHFEKIGEARARQDLLDLARRREIDNPGYASDLRAAASWVKASGTPAERQP